jgi:hypothetical protein
MAELARFMLWVSMRDVSLMALRTAKLVKKGGTK